MRNFMISLILSISAAVLIVVVAFEQNFSIRYVSDAMFIVGLVMFFLGIIMMTGAAGIFIAAGYTFKSFFSRKRKTHASFYEYMVETQKEKGAYDGVATFTNGVIFLSIAFYLAYLV